MSGAGGFELSRARLEPLSPGRVRVEFTARAELYEKVEQARRLLSHTLPRGDLGELFERALDALLEKATKRRFGTGRSQAEVGEQQKSRQQGLTQPGSRYVPVEVDRAVWQRDRAQCTFVDREGRRCSERHFLTIEHCQPFALGGSPTIENLCLLCRAHNLARAREVFGEAQIEEKIRARRGILPVGGVGSERARVLSALCRLGFGRSDAALAIRQVAGSEAYLGFEELLRKSLRLLVPVAADVEHRATKGEAAA